MIILGIESSCDDTAVALVENGQTLLSHEVASSLEIHRLYGGVVPEVAARSHIEVIIPVIDQAIKNASKTWDDIDAIAVTYGAGLGGCLLIGVLTARTLSILKNKPLYGANHVLGHVYANFIIDNQTTKQLNMPQKSPQFPLLSLIVSGGHSQLVLFSSHLEYQLLGQTQDDAVGEAFDKVAKILGLPYPGGPSISVSAQNGEASKYELPIAKVSGKYDFSFSGLKTATLRLAQKLSGHDHTLPSWQVAELLSDQQKADISASFQYIAIKTVVDKTLKAYQEFQPKSVVIAGGVASSAELRRQLTDRLPIEIDYAPPTLCTDNGAMIASLGYFLAQYNVEPVDPYSLEINPNLSM